MTDQQTKQPTNNQDEHDDSQVSCTSNNNKKKITVRNKDFLNFELQVTLIKFISDRLELTHPWIQRDDAYLHLFLAEPVRQLGHLLEPVAWAHGVLGWDKEFSLLIFM